MWEIFKSTLILSCAGGGLTLILLLIKPLTSKRFSAAWQYYIWLVVLVVMLLPVRFSKKPVEVSLVGETETAVVTSAPQAISEAPPELETPDGKPVPVAAVEGNSLNLSIYDILPIIWLCGAAIFIVSALISYWTFLLKKRKCPAITEGTEEFSHVKDKLKIKRKIALKRTANIDAPMLTGLIKPVIYIPEREIESGELVMIFMHELTHYKRRDLWYKWFSLIVNAVHWFNPLVYMAVKSINDACELSCDERVTSGMTDGEKKQYMSVIIGLIDKKGDRKNV